MIPSSRRFTSGTGQKRLRQEGSIINLPLDSTWGETRDKLTINRFENATFQVGLSRFRRFQFNRSGPWIIIRAFLGGVPVPTSSPVSCDFVWPGRSQA